MSKEEVLERALRSYMAYYDVERETPEEPFAAEAAFHSHSSTYFLTKSGTFPETGPCRLGKRPGEGETSRQSPEYRYLPRRYRLFRHGRRGKSGPQAETLQELPPESSRVQPLSSDCFRSFQ